MFAVAAAAAVVASVGDLLMLWVANALRADAALARPPAGMLRLGAALGVAAIPLYALGYVAAARRARAALGRGARWVMLAGVLAALLGAYIHAATARLIEEQMRGPATAVGAPLESVLRAGAGLLVPWAAATVLVMVVSGALAWAALRAAVPRTWLVANPAVATSVLALAGAGSELGRAFLMPAAPNIAHVVFFATAAAAGRRGPSKRDARDARSPPPAEP